MRREPERSRCQTRLVFEESTEILRILEAELKRRFVDRQRSGEQQPFGFFDQGLMDVLLSILARQGAQHVAQVGRGYVQLIGKKLHRG